MRLISFSWIFLIAFLLGIPKIAYAEDLEGVDWTNPDSINPYQEGIGDFLDLDFDALKQAAWDKYNEGDYETAAKYYLAVLRFNITDGSSIYNLACCYGLSGEAELAAQYLQRAFNAGYTDVEWMSQDPDFDSVKDTPVFSTTLAELQMRVATEEMSLGGLIYLEGNGFYECRVMLPDNIDRFITVYDRFENHDFIYATPRAPFPFFNGSDLGYSWIEGDPNDEGSWLGSAECTVQYVADVTEQLKTRYNVSDVYLLGFSQGCSLAYMAGITHHELFDGLICFGGWLDTDFLDSETIEQARDLRVFIGHASDDGMVDFEAGTTARDTLLGYGYDVTFFEFEGGHTVPETGIHRVEQWLKGLGGNYVYY
jgi:predicted esterase